MGVGYVLRNEAVTGELKATGRVSCAEGITSMFKGPGAGEPLRSQGMWTNDSGAEHGGWGGGEQGM